MGERRIVSLLNVNMFYVFPTTSDTNKEQMKMILPWHRKDSKEIMRLIQSW